MFSNKLKKLILFFNFRLLGFHSALSVLEFGFVV